MKKAVLVVGGVLAFVIALVFIVMAGFGIGVFSNNVAARYQQAVSKSQIKQKIYKADFAQDQYEAFFRDCNSVVALTQQIDAAKGRVAELRKQATNALGEKPGLADAITDETGAEQQRATVAAHYNAQSQEWTRNAFKSRDLPYEIVPPFTITCH